MSKVRSLLLILLLLTATVPTFAQVLDDEDNLPAAPAQGTLSFDETDENEELFNDMFSEHSEEARDINKTKNFDEAVDAAAQMIDKSGVATQNAAAEIQLIPLNGDMLIGISKGSFKIFQDMLGRTKCSFGVTLQSNLDRDIKLMGLRLIYEYGNFAFVFKNVQANSTVEKFITTTGDICYHFGGVPDIDINMCKIKNALNTECAQRLRWDENLTSPDPTKAPY